MRLFWIAALALAAVARAGPSNHTFAGSDGDWRAEPASDAVHTAELVGPGCAPHAVARKLAPGQTVQLYFTGTEIALWGVPPPPDLVVQYLIDRSEIAPTPTPHGEDAPVAGACRLLRRRKGLTDELHTLTVIVPHPPAAAPAPGDVWLFIANATALSFLEGESPTNTSIALPSASPSSSSTDTTTAVSTHSPAAAASSSGPAASPEPAKHNGALIAGATFGILGLFLVGGVALYMYLRRRKQRTPASAEFRARMARAEFVMVTGEQSGQSVSHHST